MRTLKLVFVLFVLTAMAISPYMRNLSENYVYWMGIFVYLLSGILIFLEGRYFERFWALGFFSLSAYSAINSLEIPQIFYYFGDAFYLLFYVFLITGIFSYLWNEGYRVYLLLILGLILISPLLSYALVLFLEEDPTKTLSLFFNIEYVFLGILSMFLALPPATFDRAWAIRFLAFGIHGVSEIWFILWLIYGLNPMDISIIWLTPLIITVLSQKSNIKIYYRS
jgi:hypothetical protein